MSSARNRLRVALGLLVAAAAILAVAAPAAFAKSEVIQFTNTPSTTQAGGHPNIVTFTEFSSHLQGTPPPCECNDPKDVHIHTPAGVIANPHVVSICNAADLAAYTCPADAQVGYVVFKIANYLTVPLYRIFPRAGQASLFAFVFPAPGGAIPLYIAVNARTGGDYGLDFRLDGLQHALPPGNTAVAFWGVPAESRHDPLRFGPLEKVIECQTDPLPRMEEDIVPENCAAFFPDESTAPKKSFSSSLPVEPFTQNPTTCVGPLKSTVDVLAYDGESTSGEAPWPATTGCDKLSFTPSITAAPTTTEADTASGLEVDLTVPQFEDPETPSPSELKASTLTLPPGFTINANAADGKTSCSDAAAKIGTEEAAECPEFAKIGTTELESSALPGPINGYIYLGEPQPGNRYRVLLTASGFGTNIKLFGSIHPDSQTGQIVTSFDNLPQSPFQKFNLHFFGSERGILATPTGCGTYPVTATFEPWASELSNQTSTQFFVLDSGPNGKPCPTGARPFSPSMEAGVEDNTAGLHSPFVLNLRRDDGDQNLSELTVKAPPGLTATLRGIPYCPQDAIDRVSDPLFSGLAEQAAPACPASQVGTVVASAGAGSRPLFVDGRVYLAGPYKGAPLSLLAVVPAVSGPYDLGDVTTRIALQLDPETAQVTAVSDPLPQIIGGIPLRLRSVRLNLDRPGFTLNPTNCEQFSVQGTALGTEGGTAGMAPSFQVANCGSMPFKPKLSLKLTGGLNRLGHPAIHARVTTKPGDANIKGIQLTLPKGELLDNSHFETVCSRVDFAADRCPEGSKIGTARVSSPLLDDPLAGNIVLRSSSHGLPNLALDLRGQVRVVTVARVDSIHGSYRATFRSLPDVPLGTASVTLLGGSKGLLQNSASLCRGARHARLRIVGQNGDLMKTKVPLGVSCQRKAHHRNHHKRLSERREGAHR